VAQDVGPEFKPKYHQKKKLVPKTTISWHLVYDCLYNKILSPNTRESQRVRGTSDLTKHRHSSVYLISYGIYKLLEISYYQVNNI
jgi:hypothetical protein